MEEKCRFMEETAERMGVNEQPFDESGALVRKKSQQNPIS
jgi:hypothetical protein